MAYCTGTDIENLVLDAQTIINLTDDEMVGVKDQDKIDAAIERADAEIDKYLGVKYDVPLSAPVPALVKGWSAELAAFYLHRTRLVPSEIIDRVNKVMSNLKKISEGDLSLPGIDGDSSSSGIPASTTQNRGHQFIRDTFDDEGDLDEPGNMEEF